jgi:GT2 family glycosyltransferase
LTRIPQAQDSRASAAPLVVISILNWNGWQNTIECLESVYAQDYPNYLTVVADNGSWDNSADRIRRWVFERLGSQAVVAEYDEQTALAGGHARDEAMLARGVSGKRLVLIRSRENLGWAGANNMVVSYSLPKEAARFALFLNNDAALDPGCLSALVRVASCFPKAVLAPVQRSPGESGPSSLPSLSLTRFLFSPLANPGRPARRTGPVSESGVVSGAAMLVSREVLEDFERTEGECFSSRIFLYWEDQLFCHLAHRRGSVVGYVPEARARHKVSASSGGAMGPLLFYYRERGKIFAAKAAPLGWRALFHLVNPALCLARVAKYSFLNSSCARAAFCGWVDGLRGVGGKWREHDRFASPPAGPAPLLLVEGKEP